MNLGHISVFYRKEKKEHLLLLILDSASPSLACTTFSDCPHFSTYDNPKLPLEKDQKTEREKDKITERQNDKKEHLSLIGYICQHTTTNTTTTRKKKRTKKSKDHPFTSHSKHYWALAIFTFLPSFSCFVLLVTFPRVPQPICLCICICLCNFSCLVLLVTFPGVSLCLCLCHFPAGDISSCFTVSLSLSL